MSEQMNFEKPYAIRGADGTVSWLGAAIAKNVYMVKNTGAAAMLAGAAVIIDTSSTTQTVIPRCELPGTDDPLSPTAGPVQLGLIAGINVVNASSVGFLGIALEPIAINALGRVGGPGTIAGCRSTATAIALGALVGGSGTAAQVTTVVTSATLNLVLGICLQTNTVAAPGTGSTASVGVLVSPQH